MTKEQVEELISKSPPQDHERIRLMLQHSCSFYDHTGKHHPHPYEKENLLEVISKQQAFVVDTNSTWKKESKDFLDKAFVITPALVREHINTKELLLDRARYKQG